ncbi:XrtA system polysaccharide chain length determinant [Marinobacter fonticola]|uniref:XrtA system polysaccharide chain length determinant n=1 Tax=Marinobacter fonticola TaxID=2603215 RepID=UPI0011E6136D|nr:XrtA system polysaccharide chain length determinant [Marinobacter fonticola]
MALPLSQLPGEIIREVRGRKWLALAVFAIVSFGVLALGFIWPYKYQSQVVIYVDDENIIRPLMEGSAVTTEINEQASSAQQLLWSRNVMEQLATNKDIFGSGAAELSNAQIEGRVQWLRQNLSVETQGEDYFGIQYRSESPQQAFKIAQQLGQLFIEESSRRKRVESRNAYEFIDNQVKSYERQLSEVEGRMKSFLSENVDGTEQEANNRLANLRSQLELAQLDRKELNTRVNSLESQLQNVSSTFSQKQTVDSFQNRIANLQDQLDSLRLKYHDSYPDIVILEEQIAELKRQRENALATGADLSRTVQGQQIVNPLYQELSAELATVRTNIAAVDTRINSLDALIGEQKQRMERIQGNKAQYSDITRDMAVNKEIYDDLLKRREKARVSMHLDVEGQGLNYRINESARYPLTPSGPQFFQFAAIGLFLGALAPFGAVAGLLQIDPRVRAKAQLEDEVGLPVLIEIPKVRTPFERRRDHRVTLAVGVSAAVVAIGYIAIAVASVMGAL